MIIEHLLINFKRSYVYWAATGMFLSTYFGPTNPEACRTASV